MNFCHKISGGSRFEVFNGIEPEPIKISRSNPVFIAFGENFQRIGRLKVGVFTAPRINIFEGEKIPLVNINQAGLNELVSLPGIGPVTAEKIINYREENLFTRIEDIQKVPGIGPSTFEQIKEYLTVGE